MKIDDVELTLFNWDNIPPTRYHAGSRNMGGSSNLGLLTIKTDCGHHRPRLPRRCDQPGRIRCRRADPLPQAGC